MNRHLVWTNYMELGSTAYLTGEYGLAEAMLKQAAKETHKLDQGNIALAAVLENLAVVFVKQQRVTKAERVLKRAQALYERNADSPAPVCRILFKLAELYFIQAKTALADRTIKEALEKARSMRERDKHMEIEHLLRLSNRWNEIGRYEEAIQLYKEVMHLRNPNST